MLFWTLALLMLAVAVLCVLLPLARRAESPSDDDGSVDLYLQQLADIDQKSAELEAPSEEIQQERGRDRPPCAETVTHQRLVVKACCARSH